MSLRLLAVVAAFSVLVVTGWALFGRTADSRAAAPAPHELRSVEVRNDCSDPVWISYGRSEPLRDEDALLLGGNSSSTSAMIEGDMVWLLDQRRQPLSHAVVETDTVTIVIDESCMRIAVRPTLAAAV